MSFCLHRAAGTGERVTTSEESRLPTKLRLENEILRRRREAPQNDTKNEKGGPNDYENIF